MFKKVGIIALISILVVLLIATLAYVANKPVSQANGFTRALLHRKVTQVGSLNFSMPVVNIAGRINDSLFFATDKPGLLIVSNLNLQGINNWEIPIAKGKVRSVVKTVMSSSSVYIIALNVPAIVRYQLYPPKEDFYALKNTFTRYAVLSENTIIIRGFDTTLKDQVFSKVNLLTNKYENGTGITERHDDGGFKTDGLLSYDRVTHCLVYTHFYSNKILFFDTNLAKISISHTIDTFSNYQIQTKTATSAKRTFGITAPPRLLNLYSTTDKGKLYILSELKADNDDEHKFSTNSVIDVYDIVSRRYEGSLYIPLLENKKMYQFRLFDNILVALYNKSVAVYRLDGL